MRNIASLPNREHFRNEDWISAMLNIKPRTTMVALTRIRTGHTQTLAHWGRLSLKVDKSCRRCGESQETVEHLLLECTRVAGDLKDCRHEFIRWWKRHYPCYSFNQLVVLNTAEFTNAFTTLLNTCKANNIFL